MRQRHTLQVLVAVLALLLVGAGKAQSQESHETFHLCPSGGPCPAATDPGFGVVSLADTTPTLNIFYSGNPDVPGGTTATFANVVYAVFVPTGGPTLTVSVTWGALSGSTSTPVAGTWGSGFLFGPDGTPGGFLGLAQTGGPASPFDAFSTATDAFLGTTISGYDVYLVELVGAGTFETAATHPDSFVYTGDALPLGSIVYVFAANGPLCLSGCTPATVLDTTAPSSSILITPEPGSIALLGSGLLALGGALRRRWQK